METELGAKVIRTAKKDTGMRFAELAYHVARRDDPATLGPYAMHPIVNAVYDLAIDTGDKRDLPEDERLTLFCDLQLRLAEELRAYWQRCKARSYLGWSNAAKARGHELRYAPADEKLCMYCSAKASHFVDCVSEGIALACHPCAVVNTAVEGCPVRELAELPPGWVEVDPTPGGTRGAVPVADRFVGEWRDI